MAFARLEIAEAVRSRWLLFTAFLYLATVTAFVWLGLHESTVLGFTGLTRVILNIASAVMVVFPLLVLVATHSAITRAKTSGFCELLLTQPASRAEWFTGLWVSRLALLVVPMLLLCVGIGGVALFVEPGSVWVAARCGFVAASLIFCFIGLGLFVSAHSRTLERAMVFALLVWVGSAALHDVLLIATLLRGSLPPQLVFLLAALNPSEAARVGLLSSVDPELAVLGPVGFWLANSLGSTWALVVGGGWPLLVGAASAWRAFANLKRADLIA
jgi:ABC-type transport system involved in multi-copper enzyme maturation permease subunit